MDDIANHYDRRIAVLEERMSNAQEALRLQAAKYDQKLDTLTSAPEKTRAFLLALVSLAISIAALAVTLFRKG